MPHAVDVLFTSGGVGPTRTTTNDRRHRRAGFGCRGAPSVAGAHVARCVPATALNDARLKLAEVVEGTELDVPYNVNFPDLSGR